MFHFVKDRQFIPMPMKVFLVYKLDSLSSNKKNLFMKE